MQGFIKAMFPVLAGLLVASCGGGGDGVQSQPPNVRALGQPLTPIESALCAGSLADAVTVSYRLVDGICTRYFKPLSPRTAQVATATTKTVDGPALMAWAEQQYPQYFSGASVAGTYGIYSYRFYQSTQNYLAIGDGGVYVLGPITDGEVLFVGTLASFICQVYPNCGLVVSEATASPYVTQGNVHDLLKNWRSTQSLGGTVIIYSHNTDGTTGGLFQRTTGVCSGQIEADGSITYTSGGQAIKYQYEDSSGATNTFGASRAKLYPTNTSINQADASTYIEIIKDVGYRIVHNSSSLEQWCAGPSLYDIAGRFPNVDGHAGSASGTYIGRVADVPMDNWFATTTLPSYVKRDAPCKATVNSLGQITVMIGGVTLPVFYTTDLLKDQTVTHTMFSASPLVNPKITYALEYGATGFSGAFMVHIAPMTYYDNASPSFISDWSVACVTTKQ